jgi:penicillin-binding protein 1A
VNDAEGKVLFEAPTPPFDETQRVIPARNAFLTSTLLQEVTRSGTAAKAQGQLKRPDLFGKTGTTNDVYDAWFAGFQPHRVAVVWIGYDTPRSLGSHASGSSLALPAWIQFMHTALAREPVQPLVVPDGVVSTDSGWRYAEWAEGGFLASLGEGDEPISPAMIPQPPDPNAPKEEPGHEKGFFKGLQELFGF